MQSVGTEEAEVDTDQTTSVAEERAKETERFRAFALLVM